MLIRHAEKSNEGLRDNPGLSVFGSKQAQELKRLIETKALPTPTKLHCSPKLRTEQTLQPAAKAFGIELQILPELDEKKTHETMAEFRKRIQLILTRMESQLGVIYLCTHFDWLEEATNLIHCDQALSGTNWTSSHIIEFEIQDRIWILQKEKDVLL